MFINIVEFPPTKSGKDDEFKEWFAWSNGVYEKSNGFISRRLLRPTGEGPTYGAIVEYESVEAFNAVHFSPEREEAWARVEPLLDGKPKAHFYEVVLRSRPGSRVA
jgi:heme-degrading monooxygenase HmoA